MSQRLAHRVAKMWTPEGRVVAALNHLDQAVTQLDYLYAETRRSVVAPALRLAEQAQQVVARDVARDFSLPSRFASVTAGLEGAKTAGRHPLDGVRGHQLLPDTIMRKIPALGAQEDVEDPVVWLKLFSPYGKATWLITEYDPQTGEAFGWADLGFGELGYIDLRELQGLNRRGLPLVERDTSWRPMLLSRAKQA